MAMTGTSTEQSTLEKLLVLELRSRRRARRWRLLRNLLIVLLVAGVFWFMRQGGLSSVSVVMPHTAVVEIRGPIAGDADASAESVIDAVRDAMKDFNTRALVLLIDSPGGSPVQASMINDEIRRLRELHDKPVYAVVEESCASGAYYIAAAADDIYVNPASLVGSIGVLMDGFGFVGSMEKLGVERRLMTAGDNKGFLDPFSPLNEEQSRAAQQMLDQIHQQFITVVQEGRGDRLKPHPQLFSGLFWTGEQAVQMGLADGLGSLDSVARDVVGVENIVDYTNRPNPLERVVRRFGLAVGEGVALALRAGGSLPTLR